jgi:dTDP-4-dehydrorhamnose reductase
MTILVTGASGLLGRSLIALLEKTNIPYIGTYKTRPIKNGYNINFDNEDEIYYILKEYNIRTCVNCIVERQVDICENNWEKIKKINIDLVDKLSRQCNRLNINLIHISTDYVFDGKNSPYFPTNHNINPLQNYGISKLISEYRIISNMIKTSYSIIRVPVLYSDNIENLSENAVTLIGKKVLNQIETYTEDDYSIRRPVFIPDFCNFILYIINNPRNGIFHYYNPEDKTTKYRTAHMIANYLNKTINHITPISSFLNTANRPYDTELKDDQYDITLYHSTKLEDGLEKCFKKWKHPNIIQSSYNDIFIMIDLDGTILNTDITHYKAYKKTLNEYNIDLSWNVFEKYINISSIEEFIKECGLNIDEVKSKKTKYLLMDNNIEYISGADLFISKLIDNNTNFVIVTNTSKNIVEHYMKCQPLLQNVKQWVCREDYTYAKPSSNCYDVAIQQFYKNELYTIGFENSINGYNAIKNTVKCVYFITNKQMYNYNIIKEEDIYLINDFNHFF